MSAMLEYSEINSPIHKLTGATKLICLVIWALASMVTYDTRILVVMVICSIAIFKISKVEFKTVSFVFYLILVFLLINNIAIFLFSPFTLLLGNGGGLTLRGDRIGRCGMVRSIDIWSGAPEKLKQGYNANVLWLTERHAIPKASYSKVHTQGRRMTGRADGSLTV